MPITQDITRSIENTLDSKPVYAVAGAGDLAVEKLRELSGWLTSLSDRIEPNDVQAQVGTLQKDAQTRFEAVRGAVRDIPDQAQSVLALLVATANDVYGDLAARGENVVSRIRRQQSTTELREQAQSTVRRAKATKTTATKGVTATKRAAKGTVTAATKTAEAAGKAAADAADKIG